MNDERVRYLASGAGQAPEDQDRLDLVRSILGAEATWAEPPPEVADGLFDEIGATRRGAPTQQSSPRRRWAWPAAAILGVAAVVIVLAGVFGVFSSSDQEVIAISGTELEPTASGEAAIRETEAGWWIRLDVENLPAAQAGTYYEGWVWNDDGDGVSIGTFHLRGGSESVVLWSGVDPADYPSIWVTLEDEDGDPAASDRVVMRGR